MILKSRLIPLLMILALTSIAAGQGVVPTPTMETAIPLAGGQTVVSTPTPETQAEQGAVTMEAVDVYGQQVGLAHKVLSADEIKDVHNTGNLSASLDHESGLETQGEGFGKTWSTLAIRGQSFRETVVLVNGQRVPESFNLGTIPTESIERVDVVEGPQALAYGSDALGGVINIVTRQAFDNPWNLQASGGDFNTYQFQGSTPSFNIGGVENTLSGSWFTTDGYAPLPPGVDSNGVTYLFTDEVHWDINHIASWKMGDGDATLSSSFFRHIGSAPDADNVIAAGTDQYDLDGRQNAWGVQSVFNDSYSLGGDWKFTPALNGNYSSVIRANPIGADPTSGVYDPYLSQYLDYGAQVYAFGSAGDFLPKLSFGLEGRDESLWSGLYGNYSRDQETFVMAGTLKFSDSLRLELSNRLDNFTSYGLNDSPTGTLVLDATKDWQIHLSAGKGYKIPTYDELYLPPVTFANLPPALLAQFSASPFAAAFAGDMGNPNLLPEQSWDSELGTDITAGAFLVQLAGFLDYYQNLINPYETPATYWTYVNIDHAIFAGTEDSIKYHLNDTVSSYVSATWISATDENGNPIQGRMHFKLAGGLDVQPEKQWSLDANARYVERYQVATQYLTDLGFPAPTNDYWDLSLEAKYTVSDHLKGFFTVENLLNTQMASFQGLPLPGRYFEGGLQASF
jgi:outer membrane cobalamin receptor